MALTLEQALDTSAALEQRLAAARDAAERDHLQHKQAQVNFAAFGLFKAGQFAQALGDLRKPLAWGLGLGLPALGVGHALISDAHQQGNALVENARNQALLAALGVGGLEALGGAAQGVFSPQSAAPPTAALKLGTDAGSLRKLAALLLLDDVLEQHYQAAEGAEKRAIAECLLINRAQGTALLRKLR